MNNESIEARIREAFASVVPDGRDCILSDLEKEMENGKEINMSEIKNKSMRPIITVLVAAAALVLVLGAVYAVRSVIGGRPAVNPAVASVMIDVNPSIELTVDSTDHVLDAIPKNSDGAQVLEDMDLTGSNINTAVNAVIGAMLRRGYLNELANSVLISVEATDDGLGLRLRNAIGANIRDAMGASAFGCSVLSQRIEPDPDNEALAERYGVTVSKANLITRLINADPSYDFPSLAALSINELGLLSGRSAVDEVRSYGSSSELAYIGGEAALNIALAHAGIAREDADRIEIELDCEHGVMIYEVEFVCGDTEYDYDINAVTGDIVKARTEPVDHPRPADAPAGTQQPESTQAPSLISANEALEAALAHAGVARSEAKDTEVELEHDNGVQIYEVEFKANGYEYDYDINAATGAVIKHEAEPISRPTPKPGSASASSPAPSGAPTAAPTQGASPYIGRSAALSIALADVGLTSGEVHDVDVELTTRGGAKVYDIDFETNTREYDYVVDAITGSIVKRSSEPKDGHSSPSTGVTFIGEARAWEIALERAGLTASQIKGREIEMDSDNGVYCYELEFRSGNFEYEVKLNAVTGAVLKFEKELGD